MASSYAKQIDRKIAAYMAANGIGVGEMAERLNMTDNTLRSKRRGVFDWKWSEVLQLADMMGTGIDELIGRKED